MDTKQFITSWDELKMRDLMKIREISTLQLIGDEEKNLKVAALLAGISYEQIIQLPLNAVREIMDNTEFLLHAPKPKKAKRKYTVNGRTYCLFKEAADMIVAQYLDFQQLSIEGFEKKPGEMIAIFLIPEGHQYNDGYDKEQQLEDMYDLSVTEGLGIADFFSRRCRRLIRLILMSLKIKMKWMALTARKKDKEMMRALELEMRLVTDKLASIYGSALWKP